jgi:hypothetical protein
MMAKRSGLEIIKEDVEEKTTTSSKGVPFPAAEEEEGAMPGSVDRESLISSAAKEDEERLIHRIPSARKRRRRKDSRQREPVVSFRGIPSPLKKSVEKLSEKLQVPKGVLVRYFLEYGLEQYGEGKLSLEPQLVKVGWSLYPAGKEKKRKKRKRKSRPGANSPAAYRGIPQKTKEEVAKLAREMSVPIGELARRFLEYGLEEHQSGKLEFELYPVESAIRTLYPGEDRGESSEKREEEKVSEIL